MIEYCISSEPITTSPVPANTPAPDLIFDLMDRVPQVHPCCGVAVGADETLLVHADYSMVVEAALYAHAGAQWG